MTVRILTPWNGYPVGAIVSVGAATETALVNNIPAIASFDLTGGYVWETNDPYEVNNPQPVIVSSESSLQALAASSALVPEATYSSGTERFWATGSGSYREFMPTAQTVLWANRPTSPSLYDQIFVTDIGPNGTQFYWNGSRWKVFFPSVIAQTTTLISGAAGAADQYFADARLGAFPVGLLGAGDVLQWHIGLGKAGTTDTFGVLSLRVGQNGAIGDSAVLTANLASFMTAPSRSGGIEKWLRIESNTTIRGLGVNNANSSWNNVNISGTAADATQVIPNITTTPLFFGISTAMSGSTDAPQISYQRLTLMP